MGPSFFLQGWSWGLVHAWLCQVVFEDCGRLAQCTSWNSGLHWAHLLGLAVVLVVSGSTYWACHSLWWAWFGQLVLLVVWIGRAAKSSPFAGLSDYFRGIRPLAPVQMGHVAQGHFINVVRIGFPLASLVFIILFYHLRRTWPWVCNAMPPVVLSLFLPSTLLLQNVCCCSYSFSHVRASNWWRNYGVWMTVAAHKC